MKTLTITSIIFSVAACGSSTGKKSHTTQAKQPEPPKAQTQTQSTGVFATADSDSTASIRALLIARHERDLPTQQTLNKHNNPEQALQTIAKTDRLAVVRARALDLLRYYPSDTTRKLLVETIKSAPMSKLRAAAIRGLAGFDVMAAPDLQELLRIALRDSDPMVGVASVQVLASVPAMKPELLKLQSEQAVPEQTKRAAAHVK